METLRRIFKEERGTAVLLALGFMIFESLVAFALAQTKTPSEARR